jgi:hypothetical protein
METKEKKKSQNPKPNYLISNDEIEKNIYFLKKNLKKDQSQIELVFETHYPGHETEITS